MPNDQTDDRYNDGSPFDDTVFEELTEATDYAIRNTSTTDEAIDAGGGNDVVMTGSGNDIVKGGTGNDYIATGAGQDILMGGAGSNILSGGQDSDTFIFDAGDLLADSAYAINTITDFNPEEDCLRLVGFAFERALDIPAFATASGLMLQLAPNKIVLLQGVTSLAQIADAIDVGQDPDPVAPVVTIGLAQDTGIADDAITTDPGIVGTVTDGVVGLFLRVDGGDEIDAASALDGAGGYAIGDDLIGELSDGSHSYELRAVDAAGSSSEIMLLDLVLDTTGPAIVALGLAGDSDSGAPNDGLTNAEFIALVGQTEAGAQVSIGDVSTVADDSGAFQLEGLALTEGENLFQISAFDTAGNASTREVTITRDTSAPELLGLALAPASDTGVLGDNKTAVGTPIILTGQTEAGATVRVGDTTVTASDDGTFAIVAGDAALGANEFELQVTDAAGNTGTAAIEIVGETDALPLPNVSAQLSNDTGLVDGDGVTKNVSILGSVSLTPAAMTIALGDGAAVDITDQLLSDNSFALSQSDLESLFGALSQGAVSFTIRAENADGLSGAVAGVSATFDNNAPEIGALALDPASDTGVQGDNATDLRSVTLTGDAEPGAVITLDGLTTTTGSDGRFALAGVPIAVGENALTLVATDLAGNSQSAQIQIIGTQSPVGGQAPRVASLVLQDDTGPSDSDLLTNDPGLQGTFSSDAAVTGLSIQVNGGNAFDASAGLGSDGFTLSAAMLAEAAGGSLPDGSFAVSVVLTDSAGRSSEAQNFEGMLDTLAPTMSGLSLAASSDTGIRGDGITALRSVKILGEGEPGAVVSAGAAQTIVGNDGAFALDSVAIAEGTNTLSVTITDAAGNATSLPFEITGIQAVAGQPVLVWNDISLEAIANNADTPTGASRVLAMQSVAVHDVVAAIDDTPAFLVNVTDGTEADLAAAVAQASFVVLSYAFPAFQDQLDAYLAEALADVPDGDAEDAGVALGQAVAARIIAIRDSDGWNDFETVPGSEVAGEWRETGPMFNPAADPHWATMDTWALDSQDQFRADAPPSLTSSEYAASLASVREIGAADSTTRTADQTQAARFWKDGLGTETTPGHWNSIATDLMKDEGAGSGASARALAVLNVSIADAMIAAWDSKYAYRLWRPETAIANADADGNPATEADPDWTPMMISPAHPDYVSGHAAASGAAAEALTALFGAQSFTTESPGLSGVTRSFESYWQAAIENAESREWGGIHYDFSNTVGLELGAQAAGWAIDAFNSQTDKAAPTIIVDVSFGFSRDLPFAINGAVLDTLSGVETLVAAINDAEPVDVDVAEDGSFQVSFDGETEDGVYDVALTATDAAGNVSEAVYSTIVIDTADPILNLTSLTDGALEGTTARLTGTIDGTGAPIVALAYQIDGGKIFSLAFNGETGAFDSAINLSAVGVGSATVSVIAADAAGNSLRQDIALTLDETIPFIATEVLPREDSDEVGATFRPEVHFSRAVDPDTVTPDSFYLTDAAGNVLDAAVRVSKDGDKAWLFPAAPMPGANSIAITLRGDLITALDGTPLDGDADGNDGGNLVSKFQTVSTTAVPGTTLTGFVVDPGADLKPMTVDDYSAGPDAVDYTEDDQFLSPIEGAKVFVLGRESEFVLTDAEGRFELTNMPSGNVKVAIDGRTATNTPDGIFWPEMVMDTTIIAGQENTLMASQGSVEEREAVEGRGEVYLPRVQSEILQTLSDTEETEIDVPASAAQDLTAEQRDAIRLVVQPGTAVDENGEVIADAQVGIATVPPELVMDMLPAGIMQHTFDLTIQAPDAAVFTTPAALTLPNVFDAPPGTKLNLLSFDHTTGRLVIEGTGTVSADGKTVTTDPGTGITKPGWHGMTPPGGNGCDGGPPLEPAEDDPTVPDPTEPDEVETLALYNNDGEGGIRLAREWVAPEPLEETPPNPGGDEDCPTPAEDLEDKEQPWINVKIEVDETLKKFAAQEGNLALASQEFTLRAGTNAERGFAFSMKTFEDMFGAGGLKNVDTNKLYGSSIKITVREQDADGNQTVTQEQIFVSRFIDATDDEHTGGTGGGEMAFAQTVNDGAGDSVRDLPLEFIGVKPDVSVSSGTHFSLESGDTVVRFDPTATNASLTDNLVVSFASQGGEEAGQIKLSGKGVAPENYNFDTATFEAISSSLLNATNYPNVIQAQKDLLDTKAERDAILSDIADKTQAFFDDAGLKGISEASGGSGHNIKFLDGRSKVTNNPDGTISYGLGGATGAFAESDIDFDKIIELYSDKGDYNKYELAFRASKVINNSLGGEIAFYLDNFFIDTSASDTTGELKNSLGHNSAHEIGHHLGLLHTFQWGTGLLHPGGGDDVMSQGVFASDTQSFDESLEAAKVALHNTYTPEELLAALKYYNTINTTSAGYVTGINNSFGDIGESDTGGEPLVLLDRPVIDVTLLNGDVVFDQIDFDQVTTGGGSTSVSIRIENYGLQTAVVSNIAIDDSAFTVKDGFSSFELEFGEFKDFELTFETDQVGDAAAVLTIESNANTTPLSVALRGSAISEGAFLSVSSDNTNLGGVDRGDVVADAEMFTITNQGLEDLVIDRIALGEDAASFELLGVPSDLAASPITLAAGETFTFGTQFTGIAPGLTRGEIVISSNDASNPETSVAVMATSYDGLHYFDWGNDYIAIDIDGETLRTVSDENGSFEFFLPPEEAYTVTVFDPESGLVAVNYGTTSISGRGTDLTSGLVFRPATGIDKDFDGLSAEIEHAIGTSDINPDSNMDGVSDFDAIVAGVTPLDPFSTNLGVVRTLELQGEVRAMFATRDLTEGADASEPLLVVTSQGLAVVDVTNPREPTLTAFSAVGQFTDAAYDPVLKMLVGVAPDGKSALYDVSIPTAPTEVRTLATDGTKIAIVEGLAIVATGNILRLFELSTGDELDTAALPNNSAVRGMTTDGTSVYTLDSSGRLTAFELIGDELIKEGSVAVGVNSSPRQLFTADDVVYVPATNGFQGGYITVDVSDPNAPSVISGADNTSIAGTAIALNGAGRGLAVGDPGGVFGANAIDVIVTNDPANTGDLITRYEVDSKPTDVLIAAGVGYVGTVDGKLHIVNFQPFDTSGIAPDVTLLPAALDIDPDTDGVQILEGGLLSLDAIINDDAGLRSVSLLVNGDPIRVDLSYPFDLFARVPLLDEGEDSRAISLQVRATDTGGNVGLSDVILAEIVPDTIPPQLLDANVSDGALYGRSKRSFTFTFDEPLDPETDLGAAVQLVGPSGAAVPDSIVLRSSDRAISVTYPELEQGAYVLSLVSAEISDVAGNAIAGENLEIAFDLGTFSNEWIGAAGDNQWSNPENWMTGEVPGEEDDVFVGNLTGPVALYNLGEVQLKSLVAEADIVIGYNTTLRTEFDVIADEISLNNYSARLEAGTIADIGTLNLESGAVGGDAIVNIGEALNWTSGTLDTGGLLTIENGAQAQFGTVYDPEVEFFSQQTLYLYRDIMLEGDGFVGGANIRLGLRTYDSVLGAYVYSGGKVTVAESAALEFTNYRADMQLNYGISTQAGIENLGVVRKTGGGTSTIIPFDEAIGEVDIIDGTLAIGSGSTLRLVEGDDLSNLDGLKIDGGTLLLEGDVTLTNLTFTNGTIEGDGSLTLAGNSLWTGGVMRGDGKVIIPEDAHLQIGTAYDPENYNSGSSVSLYRELEVSGSVDHASGTLNLGDRYYDAEVGQYVDINAPIRVLEGATYTISSPFSAMNNRYPNQNSETGLSNQGGVIKTGGGASGVTFFGEQTGSFDFVDGTLEITGGTFTLTQSLVDSGFDNILISGGVVTLGEDVVMTGLQVSGGTLIGDGALTVTQLNWRGGDIAVSGGVTIPEDGTVTLGREFYYSSARLGGTMSVAGEFNGEEGRSLTLGGSFVQADGSNAQMTGNLQLAGTAVMSLGLNMNVYDGIANGSLLSGISGSGVLRKIDGGSSNILLDNFTGRLEEVSGKFVLNQGYNTIDDSAVLAGVETLRVNGATIDMDADVTIDNLLLQSGRIIGAGDLTVTHQFDWQGGVLMGDGALNIADGAHAQFGYRIEDNASTRSIYLGRDLNVAGDATFGNANLYLGHREYDYTLGQYDIQGGFLTVTADGALDFRNTQGGIYANPSYFAEGAEIGLVNRGSVTATFGDTETPIALARNTGSFAADDGRFLIAGQGQFIVDADTQTGVFDIADIGGGVVIIAADINANAIILRNGELRVNADLTVTDQFDWQAGVVSGTGKVIVDNAASSTLGQPDSNSSLFLRAGLDIAGVAIVDGANLRLGDYYYDSELAAYVNTPGALSVLAGGVMRLEGENSDIAVYRFTGENQNIFENGGTVIKSGGGTSNLSNNVLLQGNGIYLTEDGVISIGAGAVLTLTAGSTLAAVQLDGGTLIAAEDVSVTDLTLNTGIVTGAGDLTVTGTFMQKAGALSGDGALIIGPDADALFGEVYSANGNYANNYPYVGRAVQIEGNATIDQATLRMGQNTNPDTGVTLTVAVGGTLTFEGPNSRIDSFYATTDDPNRVVNNGTILKTGDGISQIDNDVDFSGFGTVTPVSGQLTTEDGDFGTFVPPAPTPIYAETIGNGVTRVLTAADGLSEISVTGGILQVDEDITLANLSMTSGQIQGAGKITITGAFDWQSGTIGAGGDIVIASGADLTMGLRTNVETNASRYNLYLGRTLDIDGEALIEQARLYLGQSSAGVVSAGILDVGAGATLELHGFHADVYRSRDGADGTVSEIILDGSLVKTGGGVSDVHSLQITGSGAIDQSDGLLSLNSSTVTLDQAGSALIGEYVQDRGRLIIDGETDVTGLTSITLINGAQLEVSGDIAIDVLNVINGQIRNAGTLTVTGDFDMVQGTVWGGGELVIPAGVAATLGNDTTTQSISLGQTLTIDGDLVLNSARLYLGTRVYDPQAAEYVTNAGVVQVDGSLTLNGQSSELRNNYNQQDKPNEVVINGSLIKDGGGNSFLTNLTLGDGVDVQLIDGDIQFNQGTIVLTQALIDAGLDRIVLTGATLEIAEDVSLPELTMTSGQISGDGTLTITQEFLHNGGTIGGTGDLIIADGAAARFGQEYYNNVTVARDINVQGEMSVGSNMYIGARTYDSDAGVYVYDGGLISVADSGVLTLTPNGRINLNYTPPVDQSWGVASEGSIISLGDQARLPLIDDSFGTVELNGGVLVISSGTFALSQAHVDAGITGIRLESGTLSVADDVTLARFEMVGGTLDGAGELTVTEDFEWLSGNMMGDGTLTVADTATAQLGYDPDVSGSVGGVTLSRTLTLEGEAEFGGLRMYLGQREYDADLGQYVYFDGVLQVADSATLTFDGDRGFVQRNYFNIADDQSGVINDGAIIKTGGGVNAISIKSSTGSYDFRDGVLSLSNSLATFTQDLVDAGFDQIVVQSGTFSIAEPLVVEDVIVEGGRLEALAGLTITGSLDWDAGTIDTGDQTLTLAQDAAAEIGVPFDPEVGNSASYLQFLGDFDIAGDVMMGQVSLELGDVFYDYTLGQYVYQSGTFDILSTGSLEMNGPGSDFRDGTYQSGSDAMDRVGVNNAGTLIKTGFGVSDLPLYGDNTGVFDQRAGQFGLIANSVDGQQQSVALTADMVANGLDAVLVRSGLVVAEGDLSLKSLEITDSGLLQRDGDITISQSFAQSGGGLVGSGALTISDGATGLLGAATIPDQYNNALDITVTGQLNVEGDVRIERAALTLGAEDGLGQGGGIEGEEDTFVFNNFAIDNDAGNINVAVDGALTFFGPFSDVSSLATQDVTSGISNAGEIIKLGDGTATISDVFVFESTGTISLQGGAFDAPGTEFDFGV